MPDSFAPARHKGLQAFFERGSKAGIQAAHTPKLARQLARLDQALQPQDMNLPGWALHSLQGSLAGHWSVSANGNWRMTFTFEGVDAVLVDLPGLPLRSNDDGTRVRRPTSWPDAAR